MQKGIPTIYFLEPFSDTGPPMVDLFCFGARFVAMPKKQPVSIGPTNSKNIEKKGPKGRQKDDGTARPICRGHGLGGLGLVSCHARDKA